MNINDIQNNKTYYYYIPDYIPFEICKVKCKKSKNKLDIIDLKTEELIDRFEYTTKDNLNIFIFETYDEAKISLIKRINEELSYLFNSSIEKAYKDYQNLKSKYPEHFI